MGESFVLVGTELPQAGDFSVQLTRGSSTDALKPILTSPTRRASRQRPLSLEEVRMRQCKLGAFRRLAPASKPNICACLAHLAARANSPEVVTFNESAKWKICGKTL